MSTLDFSQELCQTQGMWFYAKDGEQHGPVEPEDIRSRLKSGDLSNGTLVWKEGMAQWSPLGEVLELRDPVPASGDGSQSVTGSSGSDPYVAPAAHQMSQPTPQQLIAPVQQNTMALTSMILGIVGMVCAGFLTGIPAIICGHIARKQFRESPVPQSGEGMATAGLILGYIVTILSVVGIVGYFVFIATLVSASSGFTPPTPLPAP